MHSQHTVQSTRSASNFEHLFNKRNAVYGQKGAVSGLGPARKSLAKLGPQTAASIGLSLPCPDIADDTGSEKNFFVKKIQVSGIACALPSSLCLPS